MLIRGEFGLDDYIYKFDEKVSSDQVNSVPPRVLEVEYITIKGNWLLKNLGEANEYYGFHVVLNGSSHVNFRNKMYLSAPGDIFLFKPHVSLISRYTANPKVDYKSLSYVIDFADEKFHHKKIREKWNSLCYFPKASNQPIKRILDLIKIEFEKKEKKNFLIIKNHLFELFSMILKTDEQAKPVSPVISHNLELSNRAKIFIEENIAEKLTIQAIAGELHISSSRFAHIFKEFNACSPINYLIELRLEKAKEMLKSTPQSISEIARLTGFPDEHYFSRIFKKKERCTPSQFRAKPVR
ncbi:MAG: hypothetical protein A2252_11855 [Elusimicrobia bacterium RIFOXYA2_FULL_39_19]|nr:MAG: hypothetical protein A2252_11855 [Elusimicrobia bacterium RIFOXYA2_FULL_39_19]